MGTEEDTNIVKIYEALERHKPGQYAYYQRELTPLPHRTTEADTARKQLELEL